MAQSRTGSAALSHAQRRRVEPIEPLESRQLFAVAGLPDPAFGGDGLLDTNIGALESILVQADGKIIATDLVGSRGDVALYRFNTDGSLDRSFDGDGVVISKLGIFTSPGTLQKDGKIIVSAKDPVIQGRSILLRFNTNGTIDKSFGGGDGVADSGLGYGTLTAIIQQPNGKLLLAGYAASSRDAEGDFSLARLNADGSRDTSFGAGTGVVRGIARMGPYFPTPSAASYIHVSLATLPQGDICMAAQVRYGFSDTQTILYRLTSDGEPSLFVGGGDGTFYFNPSPGADRIDEITVQPDGRVLAAGYYNGEPAIYRLRSNFLVDTTFGGGDGVATDKVADGVVWEGIALRPDGKIVAGGNGQNTGATNRALVLARYLPDGTLDTSFANNGSFYGDFGRDNITLDMAVGADGTVAIGNLNYDVPNPVTGNNSTYSIARFFGDGIVAPTTPPTAALGTVSDAVIGQDRQYLDIIYTDSEKIQPATLGNGDIRITGPGGLSQLAILASNQGGGPATRFQATYAFSPPGGSWDVADNGTYTVYLEPSEISDLLSNFAPGSTLGTFTINLAPARSASASGYVYVDANQDGALGNTETQGVADRLVYVDLDEDGQYDAGSGVTPGEPHARTNRFGAYFVEAVPVGTHTVRMVLPAGAVQTYPANGGRTVNFTEGQTVSSLNFGTVVSTTTGIRGTVFKDYDSNGVHDAGEAGAAGRQVFLDLNGDGVLDSVAGRPEPSVTTFADGIYAFNGLAVGTYTVHLLPIDGWSQTFPRNDAPYSVTLAEGDIAQGKDFGSVPATISGSVFSDDNGNGVLDAGEASSVPGLTVFLDDDNDGVLDSDETSSITQADGYIFEGVGAHTQFVRLIAPPGYHVTFPDSSGRWVLGVPIPGQPSHADFGLAPLVSPTTVRLTPGADAYVRDGTYATTNFGAAQDLVLKKSGTAGFSREIYLRFDIGSLQNVERARLRLFGALAGSGSPVPLALYACPDTSWSESAITWNNKPAAGAAVPGAVTLASTSGQWCEWDVGGVVRDALNAGATSVAFVVKAAGGSEPTLVFRSRESAINQPELVATTISPLPGVEAIGVSSTSWADAFTPAASAADLALGAYVLPTAADASPLPWTALNQIRMRFSGDVVLKPSDLRLTSTDAAVPSVSAVSYFPDSHLAVWGLSKPLGPGHFHIELTGGTAPLGAPLVLDEAKRDLTVLPGDADRSGGSVNASDMVNTRNRIGRSVVTPGSGSNSYSIFGDVNGDGAINALDLVQVRNRVGVSLPSAAPASVFGARRIAPPPRDSALRRLRSTGSLL